MRIEFRIDPLLKHEQVVRSSRIVGLIFLLRNDSKRAPLCVQVIFSPSDARNHSGPEAGCNSLNHSDSAKSPDSGIQ